MHVHHREQGQALDRAECVQKASEKYSIVMALKMFEREGRKYIQHVHQAWRMETLCFGEKAQNWLCLQESWQRCATKIHSFNEHPTSSWVPKFFTPLHYAFYIPRFIGSGVHRSWQGDFFFFSFFFCHTVLSLVTMSTRTDWSKPAHTHRPCLSGLQSRLAMGWVDRVTFCKRLADPATPTSTPSESCLLLWAGYSLMMTKTFEWFINENGIQTSYETVAVKEGSLTISIDVGCLLPLQS